MIRNADLTIDEDEAADLLNEIQKQLKKRKWGEVIRLGVQDGKWIPRLLKILKEEFHIQGDDVLHCRRSAGPDLPHENVRNGGLRPSEASTPTSPSLYLR
ncbi:MAG: hypothetical protein ACLR2E_00135 [Lachnospiraceae bacterium]